MCSLLEWSPASRVNPNMADDSITGSESDSSRIYKLKILRFLGTAAVGLVTLFGFISDESAIYYGKISRIVASELFGRPTFTLDLVRYRLLT